jgi:hypothetical protein
MTKLPAQSRSAPTRHKPKDAQLIATRVNRLDPSNAIRAFLSSTVIMRSSPKRLFATINRHHCKIRSFFQPSVFVTKCGQVTVPGHGTREPGARPASCYNPAAAFPEAGTLARCRAGVFCCCFLADDLAVFLPGLGGRLRGIRGGDAVGIGCGCRRRGLCCRLFTVVLNHSRGARVCLRGLSDSLGKHRRRDRE